MKSITLLFATVFLTIHVTAQNYVQQQSGHFFVNGQPYYFIGANYWYGGLLGLDKDKRNGIERLRKELDFLSSKGIKNLRVLAATEGAGQINGVQRVSPAYQPGQGIFNDRVLHGLDILLAEMAKRNMKAVLFLSNNWEWSGGFLQYLQWNGLIADTVVRRKLTWDEQRDYTSKFYACDPCKDAYKNQIRRIIQRTNTVTGKQYASDPTIMAWELANEPRPMRPAANEAYKGFLAATTAYIKSLDKHHLVTLGHEGEMGTEDADLYKAIHADKNVDYLTIHIWPKNWKWFEDTAVQSGLPKVIATTNAYLQKHIAVASQLQKPLVLEEFGLPRDGHAFNLQSTTNARDAYYASVLQRWQQHVQQRGPFAGVCFWAVGGTVQPAHVAWQQGDPYIGDPPMEEQGLNSVFNSDASTWTVISRYAQNNQAPKLALPADKLATAPTVNLYNNLKRLMNKGVMIGHQDDLAYGARWKYEHGRSDVKDVTGDYPAVYGWELGHLEADKPVSLDSVPFDSIRSYVQQVYARGGVNTISWHFGNPLNGKSAWDKASGTVASILPGGSKHESYKTWLDKLAVFLNSLRDTKGEMIPVIFRPFHEWNGDWFWWGSKYCTPEEFKSIFRFTVDYLRNDKQLHHLLIAFNTDRFANTGVYMERYPGDEYVDVIGFDVYQRQQGLAANEAFIKEVDRMLSDLEHMSAVHNKIPALTEFGYPQLPDADWWTIVMGPLLQQHRISYALAWRNAGLKPSGEDEYYLPFKGQLSEASFRQFYQLPKTLFQKEVSGAMMYAPVQKIKRVK